MGFLKKYPYIFSKSLWYNNGSETAVYIFLGEETTPSQHFQCLKKAFPPSGQAFFMSYLDMIKNEEL